MTRTQQSAIKSTGGISERKALPRLHDASIDDPDVDMEGPLSPLTASASSGNSSSSSRENSPTTPAAQLAEPTKQKRTQKKSVPLTVSLEGDVRYPIY